MRSTQSFPGESGSVTAARRFAVEALDGAPDHVVERVELMVSELATNCVRHVGSSFELTIESSPEEIFVEVIDGGGGLPEVRSPAPDEPTGRGLRIVDVLSHEWGVRPLTPSGKAVWFTLQRPRIWGGTAAAPSVR